MFMKRRSHIPKDTNIFTEIAGMENEGLKRELLLFRIYAVAAGLLVVALFVLFLISV